MIKTVRAMQRRKVKLLNACMKYGAVPGHQLMLEGGMQSDETRTAEEPLLHWDNGQGQVGTGINQRNRKLYRSVENSGKQTFSVRARYKLDACSHGVAAVRWVFFQCGTSPVVKRLGSALSPNIQILFSVIFGLVNISNL
jgi:hypothetical protein